MTTVGYVRANEFLARNAALPKREFDLLFCVGSWEARCLSISKWHNLLASSTKILRFKSRRDDTMKDANIKKLEDDFSARSDCSILHLPSTTQISKAFDIVGEAMKAASQSLDRKLRLCIDISTMPRSLIAFILLMGFRTKLIDEVTLYFAISDHTETLKLIAGEGDSSRSPHVEGNWNLMSIPYGEGVVKGSRYDQIVVRV